MRSYFWARRQGRAFGNDNNWRPHHVAHAGLAELEGAGEGGWEFGGLLLRQRICHLLFTAGDYQASWPFE